MGNTRDQSLKSCRFLPKPKPPPGRQKSRLFDAGCKLTQSQEQRNLSAPADLREGSQCVEVEEAVEAEELQEAGDSVVTEAAEARAGVEEVDSAPGVVVAVVVMRTSQDRLDFEGEAHRDYVWRCGA